MTKTNVNTKAYQNVLEKIKDYIQIDQLKPGDKLSSEREMAEELNLSRSTIREGLRAIELLGLIETRRGRGRFYVLTNRIKPYHYLPALFFKTEKQKTMWMIPLS
ncbi:FadR/GntR family transcriptional regulator [Halolactibacillus sp. JCM 19043]|uniref:FadR/GntR family transcriptional regulator n=1 Tax=Halolactibacillus sp. JCM 19043 TaxID=1460638 RepID=UPI0007857AD1|nr:GntR family transcriptional regulator [Halolactibacillus sp. JCM 19043]